MLWLLIMHQSLWGPAQNTIECANIIRSTYSPTEMRTTLDLRTQEKWRNIMQQKAVQKHLWDYGLVWISEIIKRKPGAQRASLQWKKSYPIFQSGLVSIFMNGIDIGQVQIMNWQRIKWFIGRVLGVAHCVVCATGSSGKRQCHSLYNST